MPVRQDVGADWVAYALRSPQLQHRMRTRATTTVQATLNLQDVRELPIPLPDRTERDWVASVLRSLDDKIELNRHTNRTLESMARAIFKSWFVDFDPVRKNMEGGDVLPPPNHTILFPSSMEDSAIGPIPRGWRVMPLDEVADFLNGLALQKYPPSGSEDDLPVIKGAELTRGITPGTGKANREVPPDYIVQTGDLLFSWSGSLNCTIWGGAPGALNQHVFKVTSGSFPSWFAYQWLLEHLGSFREIAAGKATTMGHIKRGHLSEAMTVVPSPGVLASADAVLSPIHARLLLNNVESHRLTAMRDALLPSLIGGALLGGVNGR